MYLYFLGFAGKEVTLISNYFPVTFDTNWSLYQYTVDFSSQQDRVKVKKSLFGVHRKILGGYLILFLISLWE